MPLFIGYGGEGGEDAGEGEWVGVKTVPFHLDKEFECGVAVVAVGIGGDHGVVADGVADGEWGGVEELVGEFGVAGGGVGGEEGGSGDDVRFGGLVEQVVGVRNVGGFAVDVDEAVEDERGWPEPGGEDVCVHRTCHGYGGGSVGELGHVTVHHCAKGPSCRKF